MMLAGARRAAGSGLGDMDLVNLIKLTSAVASEKTRQARHEAGTYHHRHRPIASFFIKREESPHLRRLIRGGDDRDALMDGPSGKGHLGTGWAGDHDHVWRAGDTTAHTRLGPVAQCGNQLTEARGVRITDLEFVHHTARSKLASDPCTAGAGTEQQDPSHQRRSSPSSSRQPPVCGGMPPLPRTRIPAANATATAMATRARRARVMMPPPTGASR